MAIGYCSELTCTRLWVGLRMPYTLGFSVPRVPEQDSSPICAPVDPPINESMTIHGYCRLIGHGPFAVFIQQCQDYICTCEKLMSNWQVQVCQSKDKGCGRYVGTAYS